MECVAVVGLVAVALLAGRGDDGIGPWLGRADISGICSLSASADAATGIRRQSSKFAPTRRDLPHRAGPASARATSTAPSPSDRIGLGSNVPGRKSGSRRFRFAMSRSATGGQRRCRCAFLRVPRSALSARTAREKRPWSILIAGLLVPEAGEIEIDGIALDDANRAAWQSRIAYVPQNIFLLDTTIAQNVALGVPAGDDRPRAAAGGREACATRRIRRHSPGGYDHRVGERGVRLSGGQRQRIGIARALYTDASVLILDEATNALDGLTEQELMATIARLRGRYTIIVIAHRLSTVQACDVIYELDRGQIAGSGTYAEMIRSSATFRRLAEVQ